MPVTVRDVKVQRQGLSIHDSVTSRSVGDIDIITITIPDPLSSSIFLPPRTTPTPSLPTIIPTPSSPVLSPPSSPTPSIISLTPLPTSLSTSSLTPTSSSLSISTSASISTSSTSSDLPINTPSPSLVPSTSVVLQTIQAAPSATHNASSSQNTFFANKALSGTVFGIGGVVVLIFLLTLVTYTVRRARRNKLHAISFDPDITPDPTGGLIEAGYIDKRSVGASTSGHGHDYDVSMYPEYTPSQNLNQYPVPSYAPQTYYNQRPSQQWGQQSQQPMPYNVPPSLMPGYDARPGASPDPQYRGSPSQAFPAGVPPIPRRNDTVPSRAIPPSQSSWNTRSTNALVFSATSSAQDGGQGHATSHSRELDPTLPPVPSASPLPERFGTDEAGSRESIEADAQFWSRTLKIANA